MEFQKQVNCNSLRTGGITTGPRLSADRSNKMADGTRSE